MPEGGGCEEEEEHGCALGGCLCGQDCGAEDDEREQQQSFLLVLAVVACELECLFDGELCFRGAGGYVGRQHYLIL